VEDCLKLVDSLVESEFLEDFQPGALSLRRAARFVLQNHVHQGMKLVAIRVSVDCQHLTDVFDTIGYHRGTACNCIERSVIDESVFLHFGLVIVQDNVTAGICHGQVLPGDEIPLQDTGRELSFPSLAPHGEAMLSREDICDDLAHFKPVDTGVVADEDKVELLAYFRVWPEVIGVSSLQEWIDGDPKLFLQPARMVQGGYQHRVIAFKLVFRMEAGMVEHPHDVDVVGLGFVFRESFEVDDHVNVEIVAAPFVQIVDQAAVPGTFEGPGQAFCIIYVSPVCVRAIGRSYLYGEGHAGS